MGDFLEDTLNKREVGQEFIAAHELIEGFARKEGKHGSDHFLQSRVFERIVFLGDNFEDIIELPIEHLPIGLVEGDQLGLDFLPNLLTQAHSLVIPPL